MSATAYSCERARLAFLLAGTAAIALLAGKAAHAISINDPVAAAVGGIANYYDSGNLFPSTVSLFSTNPATFGSFCTGSLINARTVLTAAHCSVLNITGQPSISFAPIAGPSDPLFRATSSFFVNSNFRGNQNDIAYFAGNAGHVCNSSDADQHEYSNYYTGNNSDNGRVWGEWNGDQLLQPYRQQTAIRHDRPRCLPAVDLWRRSTAIL